MNHPAYLIDDDAASLAATTCLLEAYGVNCRTFESGSAFLAALSSLIPGCIICDLNMPKITGFEVHTAMQDRGVYWPVIFLTGQGDVPTAVRALHAGAIEFIEKPASPDRLIAALEAGSRSLSESRAHEVQAIRAALENNSIFPRYEPKVDLRDRSLYGMEALMHWARSPDIVDRASALIAAFADRSLAKALTAEMLSRVVDDVAFWIAAKADFGHVSVNVTGWDLQDPLFAEQVTELLRTRNVPPEFLQVEVLETVAISGDSTVSANLVTLAAQGVSIALDDFGTGFGSLVHLQRLPIRAVKIDKQFIATLQTHSSSSIVQAIISLGNALSKEVVAEGVETADHVRLLQAFGCHVAQGRFFGSALAAPEALEFSARS